MAKQDVKNAILKAYNSLVSTDWLTKKFSGTELHVPVIDGYYGPGLFRGVCDSNNGNINTIVFPDGCRLGSFCLDNPGSGLQKIVFEGVIKDWQQQVFNFEGNEPQFWFDFSNPKVWENNWLGADGGPSGDLIDINTGQSILGTEIVMPEGPVNIDGCSFFQGRENLESFTFADSVQGVGSWDYFNNSTSLKTIKFGPNFGGIRPGMLENCYGTLDTIYCKMTGETIHGWEGEQGPFGDGHVAENGTLHIPAGTEDAYMAVSHWAYLVNDCGWTVVEDQ